MKSLRKLIHKLYKSLDIYADCSATNRISEEALIALIEANIYDWGNASTRLTCDGRNAKLHLECARDKIARYIGAMDRDEIYFTSGGSESNAMAILSAQ